MRVRSSPVLLAFCLLIAGLSLGVFLDRWFLDIPLNSLKPKLSISQADSQSGKLSDAQHDEHHDHDHDHDHGSDENAIYVSEHSLKNLGLTEEFLKPVDLSQYRRSISVPALIAERPGHTRIPVSASMTGIVTSILLSPGEATLPNTPFLKLRLAHEDLVTLQTEYLQTLGKLDVEEKEIERLTQVSSTGAVSPKSLLEREYNRDILKSSLDAQRESLRLHGIDREELQFIEQERKLLTELTILTPAKGQRSGTNILLSGEFPSENSRRFPPQSPHLISAKLLDESNQASTETALILQTLQVQLGQIVTVGDVLGVFADYSTLLIEGQAFESDLRHILKAKNNGWKIQANFADGGAGASLGEFAINWIESEINPTTRTVRFYSELPNTSGPLIQNASQQNFLEWQYRPGQRIQLSVPMEIWDEQFVLPTEAVTRDGLTSYIFVQNGDHFDRVEVHEKYRDMNSVVVENDGSIYVGDIVALRGAHQLLLALKNQSGGAIDPHAGHNH